MGTIAAIVAKLRRLAPELPMELSKDSLRIAAESNHGLCACLTEDEADIIIGNGSWHGHIVDAPEHAILLFMLMLSTHGRLAYVYRHRRLYKVIFEERVDDQWLERGSFVLDLTWPWHAKQVFHRQGGVLNHQEA